MVATDFSERIRQRYPEGLTGIFAIGGTRTMYILSENRQKADPGHIEDFVAYGAYLQQRYCEFIKMFFDLGGENMIVTASSYRGMYERGKEYADAAAKEILRLADDVFQDFYRRNNIDPYFVGIDTLLHLPEDTAQYHTGKVLQDFVAQWPRQEGHRKLIWEVASIPLFSFWHTIMGMDEATRRSLQQQIDNTTDLKALYELMYRQFAVATYGCYIPPAHFYLGTNKSGDFKWRSPLPISLSGGEFLRLFYTPYPTLFVTEATMRHILEDLAFKDRLHSLKTDYSGRYSSELAQSEYERVMELSANQESVLGLARQIQVPTSVKK